MPEVSVAGLRISYEERGEGAPLVLLHGFVSDRRCWWPQLEGLSGRFRVIAPDLPGCGGSDDPPENWGFVEYAECVARVMNAIGVGSAHVAGLSWGGVLAQEIYRQQPGRVRSLILAGAYAGWGPSLGWDVAKERLDLCLRLSELPGPELVEAMIGGMFAEPPRELVEEMAAVMSDFHPVGFRAMSRAVAEVDTTKMWRTIAVPTLLLWGESDARSPLSVAKAFHGGIPGSRLVTIPGGHVSNMQSPEAFNTAVIQFVCGVEAGGGTRSG